MHTVVDSLYLIDISDLLAFMGRVKKHKSTGVDDIVSEILMFGGPHLVVHLFCCSVLCYHADLYQAILVWVLLFHC